MNDELSKKIGNARYCTNHTLPSDEYGRKMALEPFKPYVRRRFVVKSRSIQLPTNADLKNSERIRVNEDTSGSYVRHLKNSLDKKGLEVTTLYSKNRLSIMPNVEEDVIKTPSQQETKKPKVSRVGYLHKRKLGEVSSTKKFTNLFDKDDSYLKLLPPAMTNDLTFQ
ncbi:unnamed protein product [Dimorphilus gyrociliatus]|uniref:Uncharacterized protein n=1 Tax=Dimorphilus gyrociliatus TaxID=2664684 RepID=A0A7I8VME7_9ANNE|nr:unnamed protein product [Dimorphilus gyrociliatus]